MYNNLTSVLGGYLPIHIRAQNAEAFIIKNSNTLDVGTFGLSPQSKAVYKTVGHLQRQFPGPSLSLDESVFSEPGLGTP